MGRTAVAPLKGSINNHDDSENVTKKGHALCFKLNHPDSISFNFSNVDELNSKGLLLPLEKEH